MVSGPLSGEMANFRFDSRNRLVSTGETSYRYDAENQRRGVNQTRYVINSQPALSQVLVKEENGVKTFYVYGLGLRGDEGAFSKVVVVLTTLTGKTVTASLFVTGLVNPSMLELQPSTTSGIAPLTVSFKLSTSYHWHGFKNGDGL